MSFEARWRVSDDTPVCDRVAIMESLATESTSFPSVQALAEAVSARADALFPLSPVKTGDWHQRILATEALRAAQSIPYVAGPDGQEWMQRADYTIANGGECKALSVLLVALCKILGVQAEIIWITQTGKPINHVTARIYLDGQWFWADASVRGAMLGESPYDAIERLGAYHVIGGPAPAGQAMWPMSENGYPFVWSGWNRLWSGWGSNWWNTHYQYLQQPYGNVFYNPIVNGFYNANLQ